MDKKHEVYIVLTHSGTILSNIIKKTTRRPYSHVSISLRKDLSPMYSFGRKIPTNPFIGGFVKERPKEGLYEIKNTTYCEVYRLEVPGEIYEKLYKIIISFEKEGDLYKYNIIGLITNFLGIKYSSKSTYFCSEFVAEMLIRSGSTLLDKHPSLVRPDDFRELDLELIYNGYLNSYHCCKQVV